MAKGKPITKQRKTKLSLNLPTALPVGAIVNYAGNLSKPENSTALKDAGWLVCNGASYKHGEYPELFAAIDIANGGDSQNFRVPDLRNRFLRGTSPGTTTIDPDATNRIAAAPGGNVGAKTGSLQKSATALPKTPWQLANNGDHHHYCAHLNRDMNNAWNGGNNTSSGTKTSTTDSDGEHFHDISGFDAVTQPINLALHYIIKAREPKIPNGMSLAASIIAYGGVAPAEIILWLRCNGTSYKNKIMEKLFDITSTSFGEPEKGLFNVPDLRGYFLRGTDHVSGRDPNFETRHALNKGANTKDNVGSAQYCATGLPKALVTSKAGAHSHNIADIPKTELRAIWGASGDCSRTVTVWANNEISSTIVPKHTHTIVGGDNETRPENICVDFFIAEDNLQSAPPIGTILGYGGNVSDPDIRDMIIKNGWLPCDGDPVKREEYGELFNVIDTTFGAGPDNNENGLYFTLPDLPGLFILGAGDAPLGTYLFDSKTGHPVITIKTSKDNLHQHNFENNIPAESKGIETTAIDTSVGLAASNMAKSATSLNGEHDHEFLKSGDRESRPVNVNIDFIIRAK